jgi:hypothetical protein
MKKLFLFGLVLMAAFTVNAQQQNNGTSYTTAVGLKMYPGALSLKHFIAPKRAVEGLAFVSQD